MKKINKEALLEGLKEVIRTSVYGFISFLLTEGVINSIVLLAVGEKMPLALTSLLVGGITSFIRGLDKVLHEKGIEQPMDLEGMDRLIK